MFAGLLSWLALPTHTHILAGTQSPPPTHVYAAGVETEPGRTENLHKTTGHRPCAIKSTPQLCRFFRRGNFALFDFLKFWSIAENCEGGPGGFPLINIPVCFNWPSPGAVWIDHYRAPLKVSGSENGKSENLLPWCAVWTARLFFFKRINLCVKFITNLFVFHQTIFHFSCQTGESPPPPPWACVCVCVLCVDDERWKISSHFSFFFPKARQIFLTHPATSDRSNTCHKSFHLIIKIPNLISSPNL